MADRSKVTARTPTVFTRPTTELATESKSEAPNGGYSRRTNTWAPHLRTAGVRQAGSMPAGRPVRCDTHTPNQRSLTVLRPER